MALKELSCEITKDGKKRILNFVPANVDRKEVYSLMVEGKGNNIHIGYVTKAMAEKLLSLDANGKRYIDRINFSRDVPSKDDDSETYGQKIVLDLPNKIDDPTFLTSFTLLPCTYASKRAKPLFLKVHSIFSYFSRIGNVVLVPDEKNNVYETYNFSINNRMGKPQEVILNICENKAEQIVIGVNDNSIDSSEIKYEIVTTQPNASIDISSCRFPTRSQDKSQYLRFVGGKEVSLNHFEISCDDINVLDLNEVALVSKGSLKLKFVKINLSDDLEDASQGCGLFSYRDVNLESVTLNLTGVSRFKGNLETLPSSANGVPILNFDRFYSYSGINIVPKDGSHFTLLHTTLSNGNNYIYLRDTVWMSDVSITNSGEKTLYLTDFYSQFSTFENLSNVSNADIGFTEAKNLTVNTDLNSKERAVFICPQEYFTNFEDYESNGISDKRINKMDNCVINATGSDTFHLSANTSLNASNCVFTNSEITTAANDDGSINKLILDNSVFNNANLYLIFSNKESREIGCTISFCDISDRFSAVNLASIEGTSSSGNVLLESVSMVKDSCLQNYNVSYKNPTSLVNFDSNRGEELGALHGKDDLSYTPL
jgi:hypothetical protein